MRSTIEIDHHPVTVRGRILRCARLRDEYYDAVTEPEAFLGALRHARIDADLFTFLQTVPDRAPKFRYHQEWDGAAVLPLSTYDQWWNKQISAKTRNMVRKAQKAGVEIRAAAFDDAFVRGIMGIYDETPVRQGRAFWHYRKPFDAVQRENGTFQDRSDFLGAYYQGEMIGFAKLVHGDGVSNLMQILSMMAHRDKAPTNALIARAVERCAEKGVPFLHYGMWSRRAMGDFKRHHAFERFEIPRYFVPLTVRGKLALRLGAHRRWTERLPEPWLDRLATWRGKWNSFRHSPGNSFGAVAQLAERHPKG